MKKIAKRSEKKNTRKQRNGLQCIDRIGKGFYKIFFSEFQQEIAKLQENLNFLNELVSSRKQFVLIK